MEEVYFQRRVAKKFTVETLQKREEYCGSVNKVRCAPAVGPPFMTPAPGDWRRLEGTPGSESEVRAGCSGDTA